MRLQKATRFALYAVLELARDPARQLSAADIAGLYDISTNHLAKVMRELGRAGLVKAERGAAGGYRFCANAKRVTLGDVIALFEPPSSQAPPEPGEDTPVGLALGVVLREVDEITEATLRSISLETLLRMTRKTPSAAA